MAPVGGHAHPGLAGEYIQVPVAVIVGDRDPGGALPAETGFLRRVLEPARGGLPEEAQELAVGIVAARKQEVQAAVIIEIRPGRAHIALVPVSRASVHARHGFRAAPEGETLIRAEIL